MCVMWVLLLCQTDYCEQSCIHDWCLAQLVAWPCLLQRLPATGCWDWIMSLLVAEPQEVSDLVLAYCWADLGSGMCGYVSRIFMSSVCLLVGQDSF